MGGWAHPRKASLGNEVVPGRRTGYGFRGFQEFGVVWPGIHVHCICRYFGRCCTQCNACSYMYPDIFKQKKRPFGQTPTLDFNGHHIINESPSLVLSKQFALAVCAAPPPSTFVGMAPGRALCGGTPRQTEQIQMALCNQDVHVCVSYLSPCIVASDSLCM